MLAWYSGHFIADKIILRHVAPGWSIPAKHTSLFRAGEFTDEAILYGILRGCSDVMRYNYKNNLHYLHIDHGYFKRSRQGYFDGHFRISLDNTQASYKEVNLPSDRAKKLDVTIKDWQDNPHGLILIIPHTPHFEIFYGVDRKKWIETVIAKIGDRPYKIREKTDTTPLEEDLRAAKCVITFNSNTALEAIFAGVPAIATSKHSVLPSWNNLTINNLDKALEVCSKLDRQKLLNYLSYHQFTLDEMERGIAKNIIAQLRKDNLY